MIHLIMSNVSFLTFPIDGGRRHGRHRRAHVLLPLRPCGRPSQPARLIDFLPAAINNNTGNARGVVVVVVDRCSRLALRLLGHVPERVQINATCTGAQDVGTEEVDKGGKARGPLGGAVKWTFGGKGTEYRWYNIYVLSHHW